MLAQVYKFLLYIIEQRLCYGVGGKQKFRSPSSPEHVALLLFSFPFFSLTFLACFFLFRIKKVGKIHRIYIFCDVGFPDYYPSHF